MVTPELLSYIKIQLEYGVDRDQIINVLLSVDWKYEDIQEAFNEVSPTFRPTPISDYSVPVQQELPNQITSTPEEVHTQTTSHYAINQNSTQDTVTDSTQPVAFNEVLSTSADSQTSYDEKKSFVSRVISVLFWIIAFSLLIKAGTAIYTTNILNDALTRGMNGNYPQYHFLNDINYLFPTVTAFSIFTALLSVFTALTLQKSSFQAWRTAIVVVILMLISSVAFQITIENQASALKDSLVAPKVESIQ